MVLGIGMWGHQVPVSADLSWPALQAHWQSLKSLDASRIQLCASNSWILRRLQKVTWSLKIPNHVTPRHQHWPRVSSSWQEPTQHKLWGWRSTEYYALSSAKLVTSAALAGPLLGRVGTGRSLLQQRRTILSMYSNGQLILTVHP